MNKNIYLLFGEESYLINREINSIISSFLGEDIENKVVKYDMLEENIYSALEDLNTMSLFSEKKVVVCKNCKFLTGSRESDINHDIEKLIAIINSQIDNILILTTISDKLDERKRIVKELKKKVNVKQFNKQKYNELVLFVEKELKNSNYKISKNSIKLFLDIVGTNLGVVVNEIDKLKLYKLDSKEINDSDIKNISSKVINDNIFDLVDAVVKRDVEKALEIYDDLLILNEEPIKLIVVIANQFRLIYQTKVMFKLGYSEIDISKHLGVHPYRIKLANNIIISEKNLLKYLEKLADLDIKIKTGYINKDLAFEMFLLEI